MRAIKHIRLIAVAVGTAAIVVIALWPEAVVVDVAQVTRGSMQVTIDEDGVTRVRNRFVVSAPVSGRLQRVALEPGDKVYPGMVVARLQPADAPLLDARTRTELAAAVEAADAALQQAEAERNRARITRDRSRTFLQRQETLTAAGAASRDDLDAAVTAARDADAAAEAAAAAVDGAVHQLQLARARLQAPRSGGRPVDVVSPCDGVILRRLRESETVVAAGEPLVEIGDPANLEIVADLLSTDATKIPPKAAVIVGGWGEDVPLRGYVRQVEPSGFVKLSALGIEEQRVNVIIALPEGTVANIGDGYRVDVQVISWSADDVIKVPIGSLFRRGEDWAVFVIQDGRAQVRLVRLARRNSDEAQVLDGLARGELVVLHPPDSLAEGARIRPAR